MKKYLSMIMLAARGTFYKLTAILAAMAVAECGAVYYAMHREGIAYYISSYDGAVNYYRLSTIADDMYFGPIFLASFILLSVAILSHGSGTGESQMQYTLGRLSVNERVTVLLWGLCYTIYYFILWAFQAVLAFVLLSYCVGTMPAESVTVQSVFFTFYKNEFLHGILPLDDGTRYFSDICSCLSLGVTASCFSCKRRYGRKGFTFFVAAVCSAFWISREMGSFATDITFGIFLLGITALAVKSAWRELEYEED